MSLELGGGAEHDIVHLSTGLKQAGHEPLVITSGGRLCRDIEEAGVPIVLCPVLTRNPGVLWRNGKRLARLVQDHGIDVLNPQGVYPALSCYLASRRLLRQGLLVPNIVTIHMLNRLTWWYYKLGAAVLNRVADHLIVESDCERLRLQNRGMSRPTTVLYNCFPPSKFLILRESREDVRREMGWASHQVVFMVPARHTAEKGHEVLLHAIARHEVADLPLLFYLAGDGPLLAEHRRLAERLGVASKVVFGGFRRDLPRLYKGADIFLLSSHYESLPLSIREGMAASLPVISTSVGGVAEAVVDGWNGILVRPADPLALASAISTLAADPELRRVMGQRGHERGDEKFNFDEWIRATAETMATVAAQFASEHAGH